MKQEAHRQNFESGLDHENHGEEQPKEVDDVVTLLVLF